MLVSRHYWIEDGDSGADSAQNIDHTVASGERPRLRYLYVEASDGGNVGWTLERPDGTTILQGFSPTFIDFGEEGFDVPGSSGEDLRLAVESAGSGENTRAWMVGVDVGDDS